MMRFSLNRSLKLKTRKIFLEGQNTKNNMKKPINSLITESNKEETFIF